MYGVRIKCAYFVNGLSKLRDGGVDVLVLSGDGLTCLLSLSD